jgi:hypothetical protein
MYIPSTFFSSQGACISASVSTIAGDGVVTSGTFISASVLYQYYQFEMNDYTDETLTSFTASLNILSGSTGQAKVLVVAGGGSGVNAGSSYPYGAGGGGGGGVVYYNQFPISSGSYEIGIGKAIGAAAQNSAGQRGFPSYIKLPNNFIYTPFTSSFITAYGGGGGSLMVQGGSLGTLQVPIYSGSYTGTTQFGPYSTPLPCASGGGAGKFSGNGSAGVNSSFNGFGGLNGANQGNKGGDTETTAPDFFGTAGAGGGGAGAAGANVTKTMQAFGTRTTNGGAGLTFNLTGTPITVSGGGGGVAQNQRAVKGSNDWGSGGTSRIGSADGLTRGYAGIVIITWPICLSDSDNCREYVIRGGASGGTMTYIPCDTQTLTTTTIDFAYTGSACLYKVAGYPTTTGTVTLIETGSCNTFIPIAPTVTCTTGSKTPVYVYDWSIPGICYPTPSSCQRLFYPTQTVNYVDVNAVSQSVQVGGWFTGTGQLCARSQPTPTITGGTITNSGLICGFYCSGSI